MEFFQHLLPETQDSLRQLDVVLHIVHLSLVLFSVFGVFFKKLVPVHFPVLVIIWLSWLGIGLYIGAPGYCLLTDWHWQVKYRLGQVHMPPSYIELCFTYITGIDANDRLVSFATAGVTLLVTIISGIRFWRWSRASLFKGKA